MSSEDVLGHYTVVKAAELDEFRATVARFLTPHRLAPAGTDGDQLHGRVAVAPLGPLSLVYGAHSGAELDVALTEQVDYYDVNLAWEGRNRITCGDDDVVVDADTAGIISPRMQSTMRLSSSYRQMHVRIERYALERHLEQLMGRPVVAPIHFRQAMDLRTPAAATWARSVIWTPTDTRRSRRPQGSLPTCRRGALSAWSGRRSRADPGCVWPAPPGSRR